MNTQVPDHGTVRAAIEIACRAPSLNNSQPWRWRITDHSVHLYADLQRRLPVTDPEGRELSISCGAALHHAQVAFGSLGWRTLVHRLPNPASEPDHLAALEFSRMTTVDETAVRLAKAAEVRCTDRRPFLPDPVPVALLDDLVAAAEPAGVSFSIARTQEHRRELTVAIAQVNAAQRCDPSYRLELAAWAGRSSVASDGVPSTSLRAPDRLGRSVLGRDFTIASTGYLLAPPLDDGAVLAVLGTAADDPRSWLATGEALSAVLLTATAAGLATCTLSQIAELRVARDVVRSALLAGAGEPQIAVRVGWPVTAVFPGHRTSRRAFDEVVEPSRPFR